MAVDKKTCLLVAILSIALFACTGDTGPQGPQGPNMVEVSGTINTPGIMYNTTNYDSTGNVVVGVSGSRDIPLISVNDINIPYLPLRGFANYDFNIGAGDSIFIRIDFEKLDGTAGLTTAEFSMPGQFEVTSMDTSTVYNIEVGNELRLSFTNSSGADGYRAYMGLTYTYWTVPDSTGTHLLGYSFSKDTIFTDTELVISPEMLFPDLNNIHSIDSNSANNRINIFAIHAPMQSGSESDFTGDGFGFAYATTFGGHVRLMITNRSQ